MVVYNNHKVNMNLVEHWDRAKLKIIVASNKFEEVSIINKKEEPEVKDTPYKFTKKSLKNILANLNEDDFHKVAYKPSLFKTGRQYGFGLQSVPKWIRRLCSQGYYHDLDIVNAYPSILVWLCRNEGLIPSQFKNLTKYVKNRKEVLDSLGINGKRLVLITLHGGNYATYTGYERFEFLDALKKEMKQIYNILLEIPKFSNAKIHSKLKPKNQLGTFIGCICQEVENHIVTEIIRPWLLTQGKEPDVVVFDGLMVRRTTEGVSIEPKLLEELNLELSKTFDDLIIVTEKSLYDEQDTINLEVLNQGIKVGKSGIKANEGNVPPFDIDKVTREFVLKETNGIDVAVNISFQDINRKWNGVDIVNSIKFEELLIDLKQVLIFTTNGKFEVIVKMKDEYGFQYVNYPIKSVNFTFSIDNIDKPLNLMFIHTIMGHHMCYDSIISVPYTYKTGNMYAGGDIPIGMRLSKDALDGKILNTFNGFKFNEAFVPKNPKNPNEYSEGIEFMLKHILEVYACGDTKLYNYIVEWIAGIIQEPYNKRETTLIFRGDPGCGKSSFWNLFIQKVIGSCGVIVTGLSKITGKFNALIEGKVLCIVEEAEDAKEGKHGIYQTMKEIITGDEIIIENKGVDSRRSKNFVNLVVITNMSFSIPLEINDRRYVAFECSKTRIKDYKYFEKMFEYFNDPNFSHAFFHYFMELKRVLNIRDIPNTKAKEELAELSKNKCIVFREEFKVEHPDLKYVKSQTLFQEFLIWCGKNNEKTNTTFKWFMKGINLKPIQLAYNKIMKLPAGSILKRDNNELTPNNPSNWVEL